MRSSSDRRFGEAVRPDGKGGWRHTVQVRVVPEGEAAEGGPWDEVDIRSGQRETRLALIAYLRREFGPMREIEESRDGVLHVQERHGSGAVTHRFYRVRP